MKHSYFYVVLTLLGLVLSLPLAPDTPEPTQFLMGHIISESNKALSGVTVSVGNLSATTDSTGHYKLLVPKSRHYGILFLKTGWYNSFHTFSNTDIELSPGSGKLKAPPVVMVQRKEGRVMLAFAGDTMLARRYLDPLPGEPVLIRKTDLKQDMRNIVRLAKPYLELADFTSVNLESQLTSESNLVSIPKSVTFYTHPDIVPVLQDAGVDYVALGNNHTFDYGENGLNSTLGQLEKHGLLNSGAGTTEDKARAPVSLTIGEEEFNFLSYVGWSGSFTPNQVAGPEKGGAALGDFQTLIEDIAVVSGSSTTILQVHSGLEYHSVPSLSEITRYIGAIDAGADLVLGHHPHVLQGFDLYKNRLIAFSLGNFLFDQYIYATHAGMILYVWMDGDQFYRAEIVPMFLNGYVPTPASGEMRFDILQRLMHLSNQSSLSFSISGAHGSFVPRQTKMERSLLDGRDINKGVVTHLKKIGLRPLDNISSVVNTSGAYRLGVDLLKRGSFETSGEYGIIDRDWITTNKVLVVGDVNKKLRIVGSARTGMKTFDRVFSVSNPATISANITTSGRAEVIFYLQRRKMNESRMLALESGSLLEIGRLSLEVGKVSVTNLDFNMPRASSKGVRLLIDVLQADTGIVEIDDLTWVEWNTPWIKAGEYNVPPTLQATHVQVQAKPSP